MDRIISMADLSPLLEEVICSGGQAELTATGRSMRPMLWDGKSRVRLAPAECLRRGDVILYRRPSGAYVLHRITAVTESSCICCGDAQSILEQGVERGSVIAKALAFTWRGRWVDCASPVYGLYWRFWLAVRPVRRLVSGVYRRLRRIVGRRKNHVSDLP